MDKAKKISVIMSCFNSEKTLSDSIESILNQTYPNFEFLILDDGSTDRTSNILNEYQELDQRIKIFKNQKNIGLTKSLNILIKKSTGKYLARQDSDDVSFNKRFSEQINFLSNSKYKICTTRAEVMGTTNKIPGYSFYFPQKLIIKFKNPFIHGTLLIEKELMKSIGGYDEDFYFAQDYKLFSDLLSQNYSVGTINKVLYKLNMRNNLSSNMKKEQKYFADCVRKSLKPNF